MQVLWPRPKSRSLGKDILPSPWGQGCRWMILLHSRKKIGTNLPTYLYDLAKQGFIFSITERLEIAHGQWSCSTMPSQYFFPPPHLQHVEFCLHMYVSVIATWLFPFQPYLHCWNTWEAIRGRAWFHGQSFPRNLSLLVIDKTCVTWPTWTWVCLQSLIAAPNKIEILLGTSNRHWVGCLQCLQCCWSVPEIFWAKHYSQSHGEEILALRN